MQIIVSDTSCLIDLRKGGLLEAFLMLPYELVIPDVLLDNELLSFTEKDLTLIKRKMTVATLKGDSVERVGWILVHSPALSTYDGFAFVVAEERPGCILLTGDRRLRNLAEVEKMEVHGVLWVIEELAANKATRSWVLLKALMLWRDDTTVRLPRAELERMIIRFVKLDSKP